MYVIFLDDERFPHNVTWMPFSGEFFEADQVVICRNMKDVQLTVAKKGMPKIVSFDHDLGENKPTGYDVAKWLVKLDMVDTSGAFKFPEDFSFTIHSKNPVGAKNIREYINNYFKHRG